ncbi:hypothetical protein AB205_0167220, partial [Aquarana catesbeiana]
KCCNLWLSVQLQRILTGSVGLGTSIQKGHQMQISSSRLAAGDVDSVTSAIPLGLLPDNMASGVLQILCEISSTSQHVQRRVQDSAGSQEV